MWNVNVRNKTVSLFSNKDGQSWADPFFFIQAADCQFGLISRYLLKEKTITWEREKLFCDALVQKVNLMEPSPKFLIICGDLVDAFPSDSNRDLQEQDFKKIFGKVRADVPVLCVCGNHDVGDTPTPASIDRYRSVFGDDFYSFFVGGVLFIVINSQYFFDSSEALEYAEEHSTWLQKVLNEAQLREIRRAIVFQHIPWFLETPDEPDHAYFNLKTSLRTKWLPKMQNSGVEAIFCGHYHRNAGGDFKGMPVVVTSAIGAQLGDDKSGARVVIILPDAVHHEYYAIEDLPLTNL